MRNILIITNGTLPVPPVKGGAVENLLYSFIKCNETFGDFKLTVFSIKNDIAIIQSKNFKNTNFIYINTVKIKYKIVRAIRYLVNKIRPNTVGNQFITQVIKLLRNYKDFDAILIENNPSYSIYIKKITSKPIILHLHNDYLHKENKSAEKILDNVDLVITVSNYINNRVKNISIKCCRVETVYNGINIERFGKGLTKIERVKTRKEHGILPDDIVIVYAGRIQEHKGVRLLIESFLELDKSLSIKLLIIGGSEFGNSRKTKFIKELEKLIEPIKSNIILTGYIDYHSIHKLYSLGDFAVLPSLCVEAFPLTSIELMACGLPVIVTNAGGMPETINDYCGFIVNRDSNLRQNLIQRMKELIINEQLRTKMSIEARKRGALFNETTYYQTFSDSLKLVL